MQATTQLLGSKQHDQYSQPLHDVAGGSIEIQTGSPPNFRLLALTALVLCCPIGLLAMIFTLQVNCHK